jgi:hypothetical protein
MIPEPQASGTGSVVIYDLSDVDVWEQAAEDREMWGRFRSVVHALDTDHIAIEFFPGAALEESA